MISILVLGVYHIDPVDDFSLARDTVKRDTGTLLSYDDCAFILSVDGYCVF